MRSWKLLVRGAICLGCNVCVCMCVCSVWACVCVGECACVHTCARARCVCVCVCVFAHTRVLAHILHGYFSCGCVHASAMHSSLA